MTGRRMRGHRESIVNPLPRIVSRPYLRVLPVHGTVPLLVLRLCGDVALQAPGGSTLGAKSLGLLAFLALEPGPHRREEVTALLWGEFPEEKARASLRQALTHLRDAVGAALVVDRATVELTGALTTDVAEFLRLAPVEPATALATDIPHFLESLVIRGSPAFEEWAEMKRAELLGRYTALLRAAAGEAMARRGWQEAVQLSERWARLQPLEDDAVAVEMEARFLVGDRPGALSAFARHTAQLASDVGREPRRSLRTLADRIEHAAPASTVPRRATENWYEHAPSFDASLVGRAREWETLKRAWDGVLAGSSRIVMVEGEPGVGKSRLADDFMRWVTSQGGLVLRGRGYDARSGAPFGPMIEALRGTLEAPGLAGVDAEWLGEVSRVLPELRRHFPGLPEVGGVAAAADGWRLFEGVAQILLALAEESPVAIVIDDLQWCDADSCGLLHFLVRRLADSKVLWCTTFTVGEVERDAPAARLSRALRAARDASLLSLAPLTEDDIWQLVRELARVDGPNGARRLASRVHEVTGGNPFYAIELLKTLFAQELLRVDPVTRAWNVSAAASSGIRRRRTLRRCTMRSPTASSVFPTSCTPC